MFFVFFLCLFVSKTKNENLLPFFVYLQKKYQKTKNKNLLLFSVFRVIYKKIPKSKNENLLSFFVLFAVGIDHRLFRGCGKNSF